MPVSAHGPEQRRHGARGVDQKAKQRWAMDKTRATSDLLKCTVSCFQDQMQRQLSKRLTFYLGY